MIRVMISDDHAVVREGIKTVLLAGSDDIKVVGEASNGREALEMVEKHSVDVHVMDIAMPQINGIEATERLLKKDPKSRVIILSMYDDKATVEKAMQAGAAGYLVKESAVEEVVNAVHEVHRGRPYLSPAVSRYLDDGRVKVGRQGIQKKSASDLTPKEKEVLQLLSEGCSSKDIASKLHLSFNTVNVHRNNIMQKLSIHKLAELVRYAIKMGISRI